MRCPHCGHDNPEGATRCAQCETGLEVDLSQPTTLTTETTNRPMPGPDTVYCARCGAENEAAYRYCIKCAAPLMTLIITKPKQREAKIPSTDLAPPPATRVQEREPAAGTAATTPAGGGLGALGALVVLGAFFLPWVRACGQPMSAWQMANETTFQGKEQFYLTPVAAVLALLFIGAVLGSSAVVRGQVGRIILMLSTVGVLPALDLLYSAYTRGRGVLEPMYGLWLTLVGFGALVVGAMMEMQAGSGRRMPTSSVCARCGTRNPPANQHCQECGATLPGVEEKSAGLRILHVVLAGAAGLLGLLLLLGASSLTADPQAQTYPGYTQGLGGELVLLALVLGAGILLSFVLYRD